MAWTRGGGPGTSVDEVPSSMYEHLHGTRPLPRMQVTSNATKGADWKSHLGRNFLTARWNADGSFDDLYVLPEWWPSPSEPPWPSHEIYYLLPTLSKIRLPHGPRTVRMFFGDSLGLLDQLDGDICSSSEPLVVFTVWNARKWARCAVVVPNSQELAGISDIMVEDATSDAAAVERPVAARQARVLYRGSVDLGPLRHELLAKSWLPPGVGAEWLDLEGGYMHPANASSFRYLLEIGGVSGTTWSALRWKMSTGSVVLKVESPDEMQAEDLWHRALEPWVHYVPVRPDLSNLYTQFRKLEQNPPLAQGIATRGAHMARAPHCSFQAAMKVPHGRAPTTAEATKQMEVRAMNLSTAPSCQPEDHESIQGAAVEALEELLQALPCWDTSSTPLVN